MITSLIEALDRSIEISITFLPQLKSPKIAHHHAFGKICHMIDLMYLLPVIYFSNHNSGSVLFFSCLAYSSISVVSLMTLNQ